MKFSAPLLVVAAGLLAGTVALAENDGSSQAMLAGGGLAAGMVVLGAYLADSDRRDDEDTK